MYTVSGSFLGGTSAIMAAAASLDQATWTSLMSAAVGMVMVHACLLSQHLTVC